MLDIVINSWIQRLKTKNKQKTLLPYLESKVHEVCAADVWWSREPGMPSNFLRHLPSPGPQNPVLKIKEKRGSAVMPTSLLSA